MRDIPEIVEHWRKFSENWWRDFIASIGLLTRIPVPVGPSSLSRAPRAFPLAGAVVGAVGGLVLVLALAWGLPSLVAGIAALGAMVLVTGGLHEDGLADIADGFGGGATIEKKLAIMRDSALGTYGVLALILAMALRATLLAVAVGAAGGWAACLLLVASGALSRAGVVAGLAWLGPARRDGLGFAVARPTSRVWMTALGLGVGIAALALGPVAGGAGLVRGLMGAGLGVGVVFALARHQIKGQTGDVNGAAIIAAEIGFFVAVVPAL
ncbi:MAG: adenosylcobinamide-GDP ribazoletransferase [Alphaproteobacteria bacterium]